MSETKTPIYVLLQMAIGAPPRAAAFSTLEKMREFFVKLTEDDPPATEQVNHIFSQIEPNEKSQFGATCQLVMGMTAIIMTRTVLDDSKVVEGGEPEVLAMLEAEAETSEAIPLLRKRDMN